MLQTAGRKCVVVDPDGVDGVAPNPQVQGFLKALAQGDVMLAIATRSSKENVNVPFAVSAFVADPNDMVENVSAVAHTLKIGLDEIIFLSGSVFERHLVAGVLPEVMVADLPAAPRFASTDEFLKSLDLRVAVRRFVEAHVSRIAELCGRVSQFNLTTHRYRLAECEALMKDAGVLPLYVTLVDRLGDYGLIGVIVLSPEGEEMVIRDWLMDSRVLGRGVEQHLMNVVVEEAQARRCTRVSGEYGRTDRNGMVAEFFAQFGFTMMGGDEDRTPWVLPISAYEPVEGFIRRAGSD
jgi:predicted enzyme involved in methoxymalonyl-ACP biosynthesis